MEKEFTVINSKIELAIKGVHEIRDYGEIPFFQIIENWKDALILMKKLDAIQGEPRLIISKIMEVKESQDPIKQIILDVSWADINSEQLKKELEDLRKEKELCKKRLNELPTLIEEKNEKLNNAIKTRKNIESME